MQRCHAAVTSVTRAIGGVTRSGRTPRARRAGRSHECHKRHARALQRGLAQSRGSTGTRTLCKMLLNDRRRVPTLATAPPAKADQSMRQHRDRQILHVVRHHELTPVHRRPHLRRTVQRRASPADWRPAARQDRRASRVVTCNDVPPHVLGGHSVSAARALACQHASAEDAPHAPSTGSWLPEPRATSASSSRPCSGSRRSARIRNRSSCASGQLKRALLVSTGFCVAITRKGRGRGRGDAVGADLRFLHRLEDGRLGARGGAVDLVGEQDVGRRFGPWVER